MKTYISFMAAAIVLVFATASYSAPAAADHRYKNHHREYAPYHRGNDKGRYHAKHHRYQQSYAVSHRRAYPYYSGVYISPYLSVGVSPAGYSANRSIYFSWDEYQGQCYRVEQRRHKDVYVEVPNYKCF